MSARASDATPREKAGGRSDLGLVRASLRGEEAAVGTLVRRLECVHRIITAMNRSCGPRLNEHDVEDLAQDTLIVVLRKLPSYEGRASLETWSYRVCHFEFMNRLRVQGTLKRRVTGFNDLPEPKTDSSNPDFLALERLELALDEMGPPRSEIIRLKHLEQMSFDQIAARLGMPPNTVKTHYYRGLKWLRHHLGESDVRRRA